MAPDPMEQWRRWYGEAQESGEPEPEAMALATATDGGVPSLRWVLLKAADERGFSFYTNEYSRKGLELGSNPVAAIGFRWQRLSRQVRVSGPVERVGHHEADLYWDTRARGSQLGAWASDQSRPIAGREALEARLAEAEARFSGGAVPRPAWWGGYRVVPAEVEFWQHRPDRLHDRVVYRRAGLSRDGLSWVLERLSP